MAIPAGAPGFWQILVENVGDGQINVPTNSGVDVGPLRGGALDFFGVGAGEKEHAFFLPPSVYTRDASVTIYLDPLFDTPGAFKLGIYVGLIRGYNTLTNQHEVYLRMRNLTAADHVCFYKVYRMKGLK